MVGAESRCRTPGNTRRRAISSLTRNQKGKSAIANILILALVAFAIYFAIQYVPQRIESGIVDSILESIQQRHEAEPIKNEPAAWRAIDTLLHTNQKQDMREHFDIAWNAGSLTISVNYERPLDFIFFEKTVTYDKQLVLR